MNKPYIICHMMMSVDGRIDCGMTAKLEGVDDYYTTLDALDIPTTVSGGVTGLLELAEPGEFKAESGAAFGKEGFSKKTDSEGYEVVLDSRGTLLWKNDREYDTPHLIFTSEKVSTDYLEYLNSRDISWIACGKEHTDLARASEILADEFGVKRMGIVGGAHNNGGFLKAGLIDEVSVLIGPGIDGREGMPGVFEGIPMDQDPIPLKLKSVQAFESGAVWIRYDVRK